MSKSTPISQLPNILLNDPQRQVQQSDPVAVPMQPAQQLQDPEEIIQETLNQLNAQVSSTQQQQQSVPIQQIQEQQVHHPNLEQFYNDMPPSYDTSSMYAMAPMSYNSQHNQQNVDMKTKLLKDLSIWNTDVQVAIFAAAFYIVISMLPVEKLLYRYIALDKIPYSGIVFKGVLMFTLVIILLKLLKD